MVGHVAFEVECFAKENLAKIMLIVSPLKVKSLAALQSQFYLYEYLPNIVLKSPSKAETAPYWRTSVQVRELGPLISHSSQEISIPGILNPKIYSLVLAGNNISYSPSQ